MFPEIAVPRLPFLGAYALRVQSLAAVRRTCCGGEACRCAGSARRWWCRFPDVLGVGAWLFVENAADLPWRS